MEKSALFHFVLTIRKNEGLNEEIPDFDPKNGNLNAKFLLVLEAPGPKAIKSGYVSIENPDSTAKNLGRQLSKANVSNDEIAIWNVVPWYVGNENKTKIRAINGGELDVGIRYLKELISLMPNLKCIVLVGGTARKAHVELSLSTKARILSCHHPSPRAINALPSIEDVNISVFKFMKESTC